MTFRGHIRKGAIVLEKPVELPEGEAVEVAVLPVGKRKSGLAKIEKLAAGIQYDFEATDRLREASKL